jgi:cytochrome c oxidase subunit 2
MAKGKTLLWAVFVTLGLCLRTSLATAATLPIQGTDVAGRWDGLYDFLVGLSIFFFVLVVGGMIVFAYKYRAGQPGLKTRYITGSHLLEGVFIAIPTILLLIIFGWGFNVYHGMVAAPTDAYEIKVIGKQWLWQFQYDSGKVTSAELYVPLNKPVKLVMTSEDVLHSFFIPSFRIKQDVVPGMYTSVWFEARVPGKHQVFCAEYCGTSHSGMLAKVIVLDDKQWKDWNAGKNIGPIPEAGHDLTQADIDEWNRLHPQETAVATSQAHAITPQSALVSLAAQGRAHFEANGCVSCHTVDGTAKIGPSMKGLYGARVQLADGTSAQVDDNYLRESIELPQAKLVSGYGALMPTFKGVLKAGEINALVAYIKTLK